MERKGQLFNLVLIVMVAVAASGCRKTGQPCQDCAEIILKTDITTVSTKMSMPDEDLISSTVILVYNEDRILEAVKQEDEEDMQLRLPTGKVYSVYAYANMEIPGDMSIEEAILESSYQISSPYDYEDGIPMCCHASILLKRDTTIALKMERLMSRISVRMDRSHLSEDVSVDVRQISICNSPGKITPFKKNRMVDIRDGFISGFNRNDTEILNTCGPDGLSGEISLYMLENMQGEFSGKGLCTYAEIELEYQSDSLYSTDIPLKYRFYLGDGPDNLDVERNCHYHITICPKDDGLDDDSWRIEKSGLHSYVREIILSEQCIDMNYKGESRKISAAVLPEEAHRKEVQWMSSDTDVASVDDQGLIKAYGEGTCTISCSSTDGSDISSSCKVNVSYAPPYFLAYPEERYINGDIGDTVRLCYEVFPPYTPVDIGLEYLEDDRQEGIYDYHLDDDGQGVTLILKAPGSGLIYMEAFEPVNDAALFYIEVNMPDKETSDVSCSE